MRRVPHDPDVVWRDWVTVPANEYFPNLVGMHIEHRSCTHKNLRAAFAAGSLRRSVQFTSELPLQFAPRKLKGILMLGTIILVILILMLLGALPNWPHSASWGYAPSGTLGTVLIVVLILVLLGKI
jgi:hypothetical protein